VNRTGTVWKFGDHVDTDGIIPARYLMTSDPSQLAHHCMEDLDSTFAASVQPGDLVVAGENFGCGSSREHAPMALKASGISCVIAASFARIFYRNALNIGLPILVCRAAVHEAESGHHLDVDWVSGHVKNVTLGTSHPADSFPRFICALIEAGGLVPYTRTRLRDGTFDGLRCAARERPTAEMERS